MCFCDKNVPTREVKPSHGVKTEYKGDNYTVFIWLFSRDFLIWRTFRKRSREIRVKSMMVAGRRKQSVRQHWGWVAAGYSTIPFLWQSHIIFYGLTLGPVIATTNDGRVVVSLPRPPASAHTRLCGKYRVLHSFSSSPHLILRQSKLHSNCLKHRNWTFKYRCLRKFDEFHLRP